MLLAGTPAAAPAPATRCCRCCRVGHWRVPGTGGFTSYVTAVTLHGRVPGRQLQGNCPTTPPRIPSARDRSAVASSGRRTGAAARTRASGAAPDTTLPLKAAALAVHAVQQDSGAIIVIRVAEPRDAAALASLDAACAAEGSAGWSEGIYQADLQPGGPNLILLAETLPAPCCPAPAPDPGPGPAPFGSASAAGPGDSGGCGSGTAAAVTSPSGTDAGAGAGCEVCALAAGLEVGGEVSLTNLAVAPGARGGGLGRRMAQELLRRLGADRHHAVLEVRADNRTAQALYDRLGFRTAGVRRRYNADGSDSLVMVRQPAHLQLPLPP